MEYLRAAQRILVFTGAGISTASGVPAFRGAGGVWTTRQPVYYQDFMAREESRIEYWQYKLEMWEAHGDAQPNAVHQAIVQLEQADKVAMVVPQNVAGLHRAAGTSEELLVEVHGTGTLVECQSCGDRDEVAPSFAAYKKTGKPPVCHCGGYLKPATISFGQSLCEADLARAFAATALCELVFALGSTLSVSPANGIPLDGAQRGAKYIIINRDETDHDHLQEVTLRLNDELEDVFPSAVEKALGR